MKELLVYAPPGALNVNILVPKKRGEGFQKVPLGHHANEVSALSEEIGYDIFGLDGSLDIQTGYVWPNKRVELLQRIMPPIAAHYGLGWRLVESEYWSLHPIKR